MKPAVKHVQLFITQDTDINEAFNNSLEVIKKNKDPEVRKLILEGINTGRKVMMDVFNSEDEFIKSPKALKYNFMHACGTALRTAAECKDFEICNGMSLFTLWLVATIQDKAEEKAHIERELSKLQNGDWS